MGSRESNKNDGWLCFPYNDGFMIAAQVISMIAWGGMVVVYIGLYYFGGFTKYWLSCIVGSIALVVLQFAWCCRPTYAGLVATIVVAFLAGGASIYAGVWFWVLVPSYEPSGCSFFTLYYTTSDSGRGCDEGLRYLAMIAWVDSALWFAVGISIALFLKRGRYQKWEDHWDNKMRNDDIRNDACDDSSLEAIEMAIQSADREMAIQAEAQPAQAVAVAVVAEPPFAAAEVLPTRKKATKGTRTKNVTRTKKGARARNDGGTLGQLWRNDPRPKKEGFDGQESLFRNNSFSSYGGNDTAGMNDD